jgi:hypothetical protein
MRRLAFPVALASLLALAAASVALALSGPFTVSAASPVANCNVAAVGGTVYPNTEVEPFTAVNPTTIGTKKVNLIAAYQQDRWSNGGAHALMAAASFDGGQTWSRTALPFNSCVGGGLSYERASDPWVSVGPDGVAYTISISFNVSNNDNAVAAMRSTNGGKSWDHLSLLKVDNGQNQFFNDKESVTADPTRSGTAYAVWDRLVGPANNPAVEAHNFFAFTGPTWFSKTIDGGQTWSTAKIIVPTGQNQQTIGNQIVVAPDGTVYDFFDLIIGTGTNAGPMSSVPHGLNVAFIKSTDAGETWSVPQFVNSIDDVTVTDPNTGQPLRTEDFNADPAVDPVTGQIYLVWQDGRFTGGKFAQILESTSTDGGATWSSPSVVSNPSVSVSSFNPTIAVGSDGTVGLDYYDFRNLQAGNTTTLPTDVWFRSAPRGGSFGAETHVVGSFNTLAAPNAGGFFLGDYEGMAANGTSFIPVFAATNCNDTSCSATAGASNPDDIYAAGLP